MRNLKTNLIILAVVATLLGVSGLTVSYGANPKLAEVIYITRSKACGCSAKSAKHHGFQEILTGYFLFHFCLQNLWK